MGTGCSFWLLCLLVDAGRTRLAVTSRPWYVKGSSLLKAALLCFFSCWCSLGLLHLVVGALSLCFTDSQALLSPSNRQDFVKLVMQGPKPRLRTSKKHQQLESSINCLLLEPGWCPQRCQMCLPLLSDTNFDIELKGTDRCSGKSQLTTGESQMKIGLTLLSFMLCECTRILCLAKKEAIRR